jgi:hydroxyacylglutathione hydrolase
VIFQPFYYPETGCAAYLLGCAGLGKCAVVDAHIHDVERYVAFAESKGMAITHTIDTHVHADHVSGGQALAARTGARYCLHASADVRLDFAPLEDGEEIELGNVRARVLHTPGHTPESICLLVTDLRRGPEPWFLLTGDTLFVGAVGRPDLPGDAERSAAELYESIHSKLLSLPDTLEIYPAHFAGSACGAGMSGKPMSTLAFERQWNPLLGLGRNEFVGATSSGIPEKPVDLQQVMRANQGRS